ncbi:MAG TPA: SMC-Scp complex subunit ScpB [Microbacteriaceae bacterium]|nr:SMC-Scp complex subunit ScpB [Microbacteriaceae bacterium]
MTDNETSIEPDVVVGREDVPAAVEALLFVADEPLTLMTIATALSMPLGEVESIVRTLAAEYDSARRGFELREVGGGWRLYVREKFDDVVRDFVLTQSPSKLSQAALETLSVIAYKQPVSRSAVAAVRAVNVDSVVRTLVSRGFITEVDTDPETGATLYGTTDLLLTQLGINSLDELPRVAPLLDDGSEGFDDVIAS